VTPVSVEEKNEIGALAGEKQVSLKLVKGRILNINYFSTVFNNMAWKAAPDLGTMVIINCLKTVNIWGRQSFEELSYQQLITRLMNARTPISEYIPR